MKRKVLAMLVPALLVAGAANAAEVYNKDGNKLDFYGKVAGLHYFSDNSKHGPICCQNLVAIPTRVPTTS